MGGENMADIGTEKMAVASKETGPTTKFGTALVGFADQMDALAGKETNLTHRQMWLAIGTEAVIGATAIALVGSSKVSSEAIVYGLMEKMKYTGIVDNWPDWGRMSIEGEQMMTLGSPKPDMKLVEVARALVEGGFKDEFGTPVYLLGNESTKEIIRALGQFRVFENKREQIKDLFLLGGVGSAVIAALHSKAGEKVKVSAPVGKMPAVLPTIANVMRGIGKLF